MPSDHDGAEDGDGDVEGRQPWGGQEFGIVGRKGDQHGDRCRGEQDHQQHMVGFRHTTASSLAFLTHANNVADDRFDPHTS